MWERKDNDVFLIGPQHFDLSIAEVRDKLTEISGMRDVIAKDLWDSQQSAHAQVIDLLTGKEAATQLGSLLLTASLSTAVNAVKGLTAEEMVECLTTPLREPSDFLAAFEELEKVAWYLHHNEGRYYFDRQENLTKLLQSLAHDAPQNQVDDLVRHRLRDMFKATRKTCYEDVLPLPTLEDVADRVRKGRVLLIVSPDSKVPPEEVQKFFDGLSQKNNLCVLTGDKTAMGSVEKAARQHFAAQKADGRIAKGHPQRDDLERKQQSYEQDFNSTILNLFDKVLFPIQRAGKLPQLVAKALDMTRDSNKPFIGEEQIEKTLDGSEPRDGTPYAGPIVISDGDVLLRAFAEADGLEVKNDFRYPAKGKKGVQIDEIKPGNLISRTGRKLDSRTKTFEGLKQAAEKSVTFEGIAINVGQGNQVIAINVGEIPVDAAFILALLTKVLEKFGPETPITMSFRKGHFASGHDLKDFANKLGIELQQAEVEQ